MSVQILLSGTEWLNFSATQYHVSGIPICFQFLGDDVSPQLNRNPYLCVMSTPVDTLSVCAIFSPVHLTYFPILFYRYICRGHSPFLGLRKGWSVIFTITTLNLLGSYVLNSLVHYSR